jgi:predicted nucleic acid-binding protein
MKTKAVIDSSTLISLAKIDALGVLQEMDCEIICPEEVYQECVVVGALNGRVDAVQIKRLFDEKTVSTKTVEVKERIPGLSPVDCMVLALAIQEKPVIVFANDTKLARRIELAGFDARGSPDILLRMKRTGVLDDKRYASLIKLLGTKMRLSASNVEKYLEAEK